MPYFLLSPLDLVTDYLFLQWMVSCLGLNLVIGKIKIIKISISGAWKAFFGEFSSKPDLLLLLENSLSKLDLLYKKSL